MCDLWRLTWCTWRSAVLGCSSIHDNDSLIACVGTCVQDVRRQLYSLDDDRTFFDWIQKELRTVERRLEDGRAVLAHLEGALINVSCDDPGAPIGQQLALPMLQERLDARARGYAAQRAAAAEEAIIKEEVRPLLLHRCWRHPDFVCL